MIEGNPGDTSNFSLTLNRLGSINESDTVEVELVSAGDNPAQASDFVDGFSSRQVTFAPGEDTKTIDISINPDQKIEVDETFGVRLTNVSGSALVSSEELIFAILDDEPQPLDFAGNTINDAYQINLNGNGTTRTFKEWVGSTDSDDYYRLTIGSTSDFNLELNGLSDDANVRLVNSNGDTIVGSYNYGTTAESISETILPGDYYIHVNPAWGYGINTSYNLNVSTTALDFVGNTINDAYQINLNGNGTTRTFKEWVGSTDSDDYYRLTIGSTSDFNLELNGLSDDANVRLTESNGDTIVGSYNYGTTAESINGTILPGDYYIHVNQAWGYDIDASYNLNVSVDAFN
ncbi:MAG: Calx-beta domain-containing protein [Rivularia sp. (in: cyanobacteria)]